MVLVEEEDNYSVTDGVTDSDGVTDGVTEGVTDGVADGVAGGDVDGITAGDGNTSPQASHPASPSPRRTLVTAPWRPTPAPSSSTWLTPP